MVGARTRNALLGLAASLAVTAVAWVVFDTLLVFLVVPFVPFLLRGSAERERPPVQRCPACGFSTRDPAYDYCPRDGTELE